MNSVQPTLLEHVLERMPVGVAILDCASLRILYMNTYLQSLLPSSWSTQSLIGHSLRDIVPDQEYKIVEPYIQEVCLTGRTGTFSDIPYEGFLETRGRTYWHISIERIPGTSSSSVSEEQDFLDLQNKELRLLITINDMTNHVRSSLHLNAIHQISSAILERFALPQVLDSILQAVQDLVGSTRCAIVLLDHTITVSNQGKNDLLDKNTHTAVVAAQKGLHLSSQNWHPLVNEQLLLNQVLHSYHSLVIPDTDAWPGITFPLLDDNGIPRRPGSVLCVPIFEPDPTTRANTNNPSSLVEQSSGSKLASKAILGTIEVYHRRTRGLPIEEVELLEQFAQQAGLAIQNARLLLSVDRTKELAQQNQALQAAQAAQAFESARLRHLMKRLPSGVMLVSAHDKSISIINYQAVELLQRMGVPLRSFDDPDLVAEDAVGLNIENALRALTLYDSSGTIIEYEEQPLFRALQNGEASEVELRITQPDAQMLFLLISAAPLHNHGGSISDAILVLQDFTKLKILERAREDFFTTMAHELKTPLANIRAHLSALQADDFKWSPEAQRNFLETADEQVERLVGMINHFLDASRIEAGALRLELEPILLPEMFEDLQERLEALITSSQRRFEIHAPGGLPAIQADYELIMSVLTNLLSNAFRYAPEGDTVRLEAEPIFDTSNDHIVEVEIRVIDRGPGITEERQAELFTRFSTFASMRRPTADRPGQPIAGLQRGNPRWSPATGLGLYISRGIIQAHDSELRLKSNPGEGATFAFTLPVAASINSKVL